MTSLETVISAYQNGDPSEVLVLAGKAVEHDPLRISHLDFITASALLKLGRLREAAEAFAKVGRSVSPKADECLAIAVTLLFSERAFERVADLLDDVESRLSTDAGVVFKLVKSLAELGRLPQAHAIIGGLDCDQRPHLDLLIGFLQATKDDVDRQYAILLANAARYPDNAFVLSALSMRAMERCDFLVQDHFAARLREPGFGERLARFEMGWARLVRSDDERELAAPSFAALEVMRHAALSGERVRRRPVRPDGRLCIAYFSSDFRLHATMTLFEDVLLRHDRSRFEIILLCYSPEGAEIYQENWPEALRSCVIRVRDMTSEAIQETIRTRNVDILVDLHGHTARARLDVVDRCDAPIKVTYLGFPGTVAGVDLDYAITDRIVTPDSSKPHFHEKLCRLPETYQANSLSGRTWQRPAARAAVGLPQDCFLFGSFNATQKIDRQAVILWSRVLDGVPGSLLAIHCARPVTADNLRFAFKRQGIAADRLVFFGNCDHPTFLARMSATDLVLDTFIYNGHTTTSDALWAGVPVLTKKGRAFAGRVSESLLGAVGLPELVADDGDDFVARAVDLAHHPDKLAALKARLGEQLPIAPLFDSERFTRHLEHAYEMMAERARAGLGPDHIDVPALPSRTEPFFVADGADP
ncbi:O-linked N-acetylglucosamine transferase, SPINDLY family protein [Allorhizobium taibaishanense]|uniref:O-GlcNAc transferase C-terminal domain-containing protein n=1 Tax=Allorhizobium taibaishanense TaxID=887144 RepID=A0A1Q9AAS2_9HYPH|nr:hypothetical protein [Allorhizobium taibaishanense]MBB4007144.1 hypothetical protein [Allorhizobium taibaishanense]OLP51930.1 hypothetical protein BJF91_23755 [Allorhizobium taibaishanense]